MNEIEKAINCLSTFIKTLEHYEAQEEETKAMKIAIQALQEKLERENPQPMVLAQLYRMDGQAVFCVDANGNGKWALVNVDNEMCMDATFGDWEFYEYGHNSPYGWKAYKTEPKHIGEATNIVEGE